MTTKEVRHGRSSSTTVTFPSVPTSINSNTRPRICSAPIRQGDPAAIAELRKHHPKADRDLAEVKLADAQSALARSYGLPSWPRLVTACRMTDAIWRGDVERSASWC